MLIRKPVLERIRAGEVSVAFRRWRRPTVKAGGTLKTTVGVLAIESVEKIAEGALTDADARRAGFASQRALRDELAGREGDLYRIRLAYAGDDPRLRLRADDVLSDADFDEIRRRLQRLDAAARLGPWTLAVLRAIARHPMLPAVQLAAHTGHEKDWLKTNVRKLKNLGLTISHHPGYQLSPRGLAVLRRFSEGD